MKPKKSDQNGRCRMLKQRRLKFKASGSPSSPALDKYDNIVVNPTPDQLTSVSTEAQRRILAENSSMIRRSSACASPSLNC